MEIELDDRQLGNDEGTDKAPEEIAEELASWVSENLKGQYTLTVRRVLPGGSTEDVWSGTNETVTPAQIAAIGGLGKYEWWWKWKNESRQRKSHSRTVRLAGLYFQRIWEEAQEQAEERNFQRQVNKARMAQAVPQKTNEREQMIETMRLFKELMPQPQPQQSESSSTILLLIEQMRQQNQQQMEAMKIQAERDREDRKHQQEMQMMLFKMMLDGRSGANVAPAPALPQLTMEEQLDKQITIFERIGAMRTMATGEKPDWKEKLVDSMVEMAPVLLQLLATPRPLARTMVQTKLKSSPETKNQLLTIAKNPQELVVFQGKMASILAQQHKSEAEEAGEPISDLQAAELGRQSADSAVTLFMAALDPNYKPKPLPKAPPAPPAEDPDDLPFGEEEEEEDFGDEIGDFPLDENDEVEVSDVQAP